MLPSILSLNQMLSQIPWLLSFSVKIVIRLHIIVLVLDTVAEGFWHLALLQDIGLEMAAAMP